MPEISEVRINYDLLKKALLNKNLSEINILDGRYKKKKPINFNEFQQTLPAKVIEINPRGKHIWLKFDNGWLMWIGFGMTGKLTLDPTYPYIHIELVIKDPTEKNQSNKTQSVYFSDMRNFATWYFWPSEDAGFTKQLAKYGPDLLQSSNWTKKKVIDQFRLYDNQDISKTLLGQKMFSGVGNYLRAEGLYEAEIYPLATIADLSDDDLYRLFKALVAIAQEAYTVQKSWDDPNRPYTDFQEFMKIYNHETDPLGNTVKKTKDKNGRMIHWVPEVQTIGLIS